MTRNVAQVPKHIACAEWAAAGGIGQRVGRPRSWARDPGAFASGGSTVVCFERGDDADHEAGRVGGAAATGNVDSGGYAALGGDVGSGLDEDAILSAEASPNAARKVFCDERFGAFARIDFTCLQIQEVEQEGFGGAAHHRDDRGAVEGGGFNPAAVAASDGCAGDASGEGSVGGTGRSTRISQTLQGLRGEQEDDSAGIPGRDQDEFWEVATATAAAAWIATAGYGGEGDGSSVGGGV